MDQLTDFPDKECEKRGYLSGQFRLFHLKDPVRTAIGYHYHDFDKIIIFLDGSSSYAIEGSSYELEPGDIVIVPHYSIHRPEPQLNKNYDRIILYLSPEFLASGPWAHSNLSALLTRAAESHSYVLRLPSIKKSLLSETLRRLEESCKEEDFADELLRSLLLLEFLVYLNRAALSGEAKCLPSACRNATVLSIMRCIQENLTDDLTIDYLAARFFMSRSHIMHLFKRETGYTIGGYISEKRLLMARELLDSGLTVTEICYRCGFKNYSAFLRAYKKAFGKPPVKKQNLLSSSVSLPSSVPEFI